jgi:hypothetical protein
VIDNNDKTNFSDGELTVNPQQEGHNQINTLQPEKLQLYAVDDSDLDLTAFEADTILAELAQLDGLLDPVSFELAQNDQLLSPTEFAKMSFTEQLQHYHQVNKS